MSQDLGPRYDALLRELERRILVIDGAMGTLLQAHGLSEEDYRGERLKGWGREVKGNHELLNLSRPDVVEAAHREYLAAGADIVETVSGQSPPAGPQWVSRLAPLEPQALAHDKPLCASLDGFTLHAATRAGALDPAGREALLHYVLRPPVAQERVEQRPDGLVRITLKKAYRDGTIAVDMDQAVSAVPAGLKRASTAVPHREVRGGAGPGQPVTRSFECSAGRTGRPGMACIVVPVR